MAAPILVVALVVEAGLAAYCLVIHFVLDTILSAAHDPSSAAVYHLVDAPRIGLMGHSLGGESSAQTARERVAIRFFDVYLKGQGTFGVD